MPDPIKAVETPPASTAPAAVTADKVTPPAAAKPVVTPPPAAPQGGTTVPLPELMEERNKRQALEKTVQDLQMELGAMKKVAPAPVQQQAAPHDDVRKQIDQLWESDPRRAVQAEIMSAMTWYDQVQATIDAQEHNLSQKHADFNNVRTEVRSYVRALPIEQRMRDGIVELAYYAVKGQRFDTTFEDMKKQWEADFLRKLNAGEITNIPSGAVTAPPPITTMQATDEERKVADAMGMSVEDYLRHKRGGAR